MDTCPHCQFLVREGSRTCDVCHKPVYEASGVPSFVAGARSGREVVAARVGHADSGFPVTVVWLFVLGVLLAAAVVITSATWL